MKASAGFDQVLKVYRVQVSTLRVPNSHVAGVPEVAPGIGAGTAVEDMRDISVAGGKVDPQIDDPKDVHSKQAHLELPVTLGPVVFKGNEASLEAEVPGQFFLLQKGTCQSS